MYMNIKNLTGELTDHFLSPKMATTQDTSGEDLSMNGKDLGTDVTPDSYLTDDTLKYSFSQIYTRNSVNILHGI